MDRQIKVGIVGGTGYTGAELLRLLVNHPNASVQMITSRTEKGRAVSEFFPHLRGQTDLVFTDPMPADMELCDLVFFATPHGTAMRAAEGLLAAGVKIVDLSADFRLKDPHIFEQWYGLSHSVPDLLEQAVYGLPEMNREQIKTANLVANPGCYPTSVQLGLLPLLKHGLVDASSIVADCKSGITGAGRELRLGSLFSEASDSFKAYGTDGHRHLPEIEQGLRAMTDAPVALTFSPHLLPINRGIHSTLYATCADSAVLEDIQQLFEKTYANERFVDVMPAGSHPETRGVRGTNVCRIAIHKPQNRNVITVLSVIDNLVKGAAGQAVQNMNLMFGIDEHTGLTAPVLSP